MSRWRALLLLLVAAGCGRRLPELHLYTWADYFKPELVQRFEREQGCRVVIDVFDSNEAMYAKLKAGAGGYDLLTPTGYMVRLMARQGMLRELDLRLIPNRVHLDAEFLKRGGDPGLRYGLPYMITRTGIAYLKSRVGKVRPSWAMFERADLAGRMTLLNDMREVIGAALKYLGYSLNSTEAGQLHAATAVVLRWKRNLAKFENEQYKLGIASGEFLLVQAYSGDILQVQRENPDVAFVIPEEGAAVSADELVIPKNARQAGLAHRFINFLHDPEVAAANSEFIGYLCPNRDCYIRLSPRLRRNPALFPPPQVEAKCEMLADLGAAVSLWVKAWDEIKSGD